MRILAIDSSAVSASCAVTEDGKLVSQNYVNVGLTHSETLMTLVSSVLDGAKMSLPDMDYLAVTSGPGSFTGIRIGVATVKGLAFTDNIPCVGVSTPEAICCGLYGALAPQNSRCGSSIYCPVMDARRDQVYNALFETRTENTPCCPRRICPDRAVSIEELARELESVYNDKTVWICGDGAELVWSKLSGRLNNIRMVPALLKYQTGYGTAIAALRMINDGKAVSPDMLVPTYLRPSQAEREIAEKLSRK